MNPTIISPAMGKKERRMGSLTLVQKSVKKENFEFKLLLIDLVLHSAHADELVNTYMFIMYTMLCMYRTLHSYKLFWAVCHLFPQRWRTLTYSVSGNHWLGGPRDMLKTTSAHKFKSCVFEPPSRRVFSINTSSSNTCVLFYQISSQRQHTTSSVNQQE